MGLLLLDIFCMVIKKEKKKKAVLLKHRERRPCDEQVVTVSSHTCQLQQVLTWPGDVDTHVPLASLLQTFCF